MRFRWIQVVPVSCLLLAVGIHLPILAAPGTKASPARPGVKRQARPPAPGELRIGVVGWSEDEKRLAVSLENLLEIDPNAPVPGKRGRKPPRSKIELQVSVSRCPGFEAEDIHVLLDAEKQGPKNRAAGWRSLRAYLGDDGFVPASLAVAPTPLKLVPAAEGAELRLFELPPKLSAGAGARLELTVLEGNPVLALLRPEGAEGAPKRVKLQEYDAGAFELAEARCTLEVSPKGRCLALLCAQGGVRPFLGAYLLESRRLRIPAR